MNEDVIDHMMIFLKNYLILNKYKTLHVTWFDGEPLLRPNHVAKIYDLILNLVQELHIEFYNSITNGTLLNNQNINFIKKMNNLVSIKITLDGCKEVHDARKPLLGSSSYELAIKNLMLSVRQDLPIKVRINVDKENINHIEDLIKELSQNNEIKEGISIYFEKVVGSSAAILVENLHI